MSDKKPSKASFIHQFEGKFDKLKDQIGKRNESDRELVIIPYRSYGSVKTLRVTGRVLQNPGTTTFHDNEVVWDKLKDMYRRFESDELSFPHVRGDFGEVTAESTGDEEGFFTIDIPLEGQQIIDGWQEVEITLLDLPVDSGDIRVVAEVIVPPEKALFGVISDVDDTVISSHATDFLKMARTVLLQDARERTPFPGVSAFYRALADGGNPMFYVSSSPWNMYDLFIDLFEIRRIPKGPLLLRDWGIKPEEYFPRDHQRYKLEAIGRILKFYPHLPFILIGDSGQEDPEIYSQIIEQYPGRIQSVYIRHIRKDSTREQEVEALAESVKQTGTPILLVNDTLSMANHAARKGWISEQDANIVASEIQPDKDSI